MTKRPRMETDSVMSQGRNQVPRLRLHLQARSTPATRLVVRLTCLLIWLLQQAQTRAESPATSSVSCLLMIARRPA